MKALIISTLCVLVTISSGRVISQDLWSQLGRQGLQHEPSIFVGQQPRILVNPNLNVERIVPIVSGQIQEELPFGLRIEGQQGLYQHVPVYQGKENVLSGQQIDLERLQYNGIQRSARFNPFVPRWGQGYQQQVGVWGLQTPVEQGQWVQDYELGVLGQNLRHPQVWYERNQGLLGHGRLSVQSGLRSVVPQAGRFQIGVQEQISPLSVVQEGRIVPVGQDRLAAQAIGVQGLPLRQYQRLYEVPQVGGIVQQVVPGINGIPVVVQETQGQQVRVESVLRQEQNVPVQVEQVRVNPLGVQVPIVGEIPQVHQRSEVNQEQGLPIQTGRVSPLGVQKEQNAIPISKGVQQVHVRSEIRQEQQGRAIPLGAQGIQEELNQVPIVEQVRRSDPQGVQEILAEQILQNQGLTGVQEVLRPIINVDLPVYQSYGRGLLSRNQVPYGQVVPRVWGVQHGLGQWNRPVYGHWNRPVYGGLVGVQA